MKNMNARHRIALLLGLSCTALPACLAESAGAPNLVPQTSPAQAKPSRYPLRLHVLAIDDTHRTARLQPNWCSASAPDLATGESSPCNTNSSASLGGGDDDFSGAGRADLVSPPDGTIGMNFTYEGCSRVRVAPGFQGLEARWIKPNVRLEVMVPTDDISAGALRTQRCTLKVVRQEFIYLRLRNGAIVRVSEEAYWKKPSLRIFLSGGSETLERRNAVVSVKDLARQP